MKEAADFRRLLHACRPCKPGSVPEADFGSLSFIYGGSRLPSPATYPPASDEQPLTAGIHGLATHETYGRTTSLPPRWALTPPFHPCLPGIPAGGHSLLRCYTLTGIKSLACVVLCVARTFLPRPEPAATERACAAKIVISPEITGCRPKFRSALRCGVFPTAAGAGTRRDGGGVPAVRTCRQNMPVNIAVRTLRPSVCRSA